MEQCLVCGRLDAENGMRIHVSYRSGRLVFVCRDAECQETAQRMGYPPDLVLEAYLSKVERQYGWWRQKRSSQVSR